MKGQGEMAKKGLVSILVVMGMILPVFCFSSCGVLRAYSSGYFDYFDTYSSFTVYASSKEEFNSFAEIFESEAEKYHKLLNIYEKYDGLVNLASLNDQAAGEKVEVSRELMDFLLEAKKIEETTHGYTNIAFGAVTSLWHEARESSEEEKYLPNDNELNEAAKHTDISCLVLDTDNLTVRFTDCDMKLDGGAIGKGYAADRIAEALSDAGYHSFLISLGGNVVSRGHKGETERKKTDEPWLSGIEDPTAYFEHTKDISLALPKSVDITDMSLVTSGSYQRYFELDGKIYHHIISPDSLYPENNFLSVSVIGSSSTLCDGFSTALFSMDLSDGKELVESTVGVEAIWITVGGEIIFSEGFESYTVS